MDTIIESIFALEILDSRGNPTVEVEVTKKAKRPVAVTKAAITTEMTVEEVHATSEAMARQHVRVKPRKIWGMGKVH